MFDKGSRYETAVPFTPPAADEKGFAGVRARRFMPATGVLEHVVVQQDRLDLLAGHYYNNDRLWWRILDANPQIAYGGDLTLESYWGQTILIPPAQE